MFKIIKRSLSFFASLLIIIGIIAINYSITEKRLERIYGVESPSFADVMLEILR